MATTAVIHLENLKNNIMAARKRIGSKRKICLPVKADAYGHGAVPVSLAALDAGVEYLAVSGLYEGSELRKAGISAPLLLLSQTLPEELPDIVDQDLIPIVSDEDFIDEAARAADKAGRQLCVHLKVDTGMGRLGCSTDDCVKLAAKITSSKNLKLGGLVTHFAVSDSLKENDVGYTKAQIGEFNSMISIIKNAGIDPGIVHAANTGALIYHDDSYYDMVRPGLYLYGYLPEVKQAEAAPEVTPIMELKSILVAIKKIEQGDAVSYGRSWIADRDTHIGIIPTGYADGFPRGLSNNHSVLIRGKAYPIVGRICMDMSIIDLGPNVEAERWDEAVIFGPSFINAKDIAEKLGTIPYEITCNINKRVPREYIR